MNFRRIQATVVAALLLVTGAAVAIQSAAAGPNPVAVTEDQLAAFGRVFPDPQGCEAYGISDGSDADNIKDTPEGVSPYAKGRVCATQFLGYNETIAGAKFLQKKFPRFIQVLALNEAFDNPNYQSAGLPTAFGENGEVLSRDRRPLYLFKVTDDQSPIPEQDRKHFAYSLSIHGIERAGVEGGIRAMEDLVTWAACEAGNGAYTGPEPPACAVEGPFPKKIVETAEPDDPRVPNAGPVLRESVIYFLTPNPDGWRRGDLSEGGVSFQRYNGNGVDLNRDWPTMGYTYRPYSPGSEPETKAYSEVLKGIRDRTSGKKFTGGIDLHGQIFDVAFSFTLLGASQKDFRKNFSTVDQALRTWQDQTNRLSWSPYITDTNKNGRNDDGVACVTETFPYCVADQWGSVVDTIGYQITGGIGDWIDSSIGLGAVGIDNEMSASHIFPNTVYDPINEQMHVDGNKGLIYSQLSSMLTEKDSDYLYEPPGKIGYVLTPDRLRVDPSFRSANSGFPAQNDINTLIPCEDVSGTATANCGGGDFVMDGSAPTLEFAVLGPEQKIFNGGITVEATFTNVSANSTGSRARLSLEKLIDGKWEAAATSFVQGGNPDAYLPAGQIVSVNDPEPGRWRVRFTNAQGGPARVKIDFRTVEAEESPGQAAIDASSMDFFDDLNRYIPVGSPKVAPVTVEQILGNPDVLDQFDSLVVVDEFMPGYFPPPEPEFTGPPQDPMRFVLLGPAVPEADTGNRGDVVQEFDVLGEPEKDNDRMVVRLSWPVLSDYDVTVQRKRDDGSWENRGCPCAGLNNGEQLTVTNPEPGKWRAVIHNWAAAPQPVTLDVTFASVPPTEAKPSKYTPAQFDQYATAVTGFAADGGNLVLTDGALRGLELVGIVPAGAVGSNQPSGRGAVPRYQMNIEGRGDLCTPDTTEPLLKDVCLPGTAGGTARQAVEPAPIGYTPDATLDGAAEVKLTQFFVDRAAWEDDCGKSNAVECTSGLLGGGVGLGERNFGAGRIRIGGALLPDPNFKPGGPRDMRFGVADYALTFAGWQYFLNLVDYQRPPIDLGVSMTDSPDPVFVGDVLTYTVGVSNETGQAAPGVQVTDDLPSGVSLVSASASQGSCSGTATVTCNLGRLAGDGTATVKIEVRPAEAGTITNSVAVSSDRADSNADNDSASATTTVEPAPAPDLSPTSINASRSTIRKGQNVILTAAIENVGTAEAQDVQVQFKEGSRQIGTVQTIASLAAGDAGTASVTWRPRTLGKRTITVVVDPANGIGELNEGNNSLSRTFRVR